MSGSFEVDYLKTLPPCHPQLVEAIITQIKSRGLFDDFRKTCLADIDTKPSYLNLKQRVEGYVNKFLSRQQWSSTLQKNQLRETLRKDINESGLLKSGLDHLVDQLVYSRVERFIRPKVQTEIKDFLKLSDDPVPPSDYTLPPPNYAPLPISMPPLPPVPPPPDVSGAMMDSFGARPPEPPSPHGSDCSVDMSDSSMVGRDEGPPPAASMEIVENSMVLEGEEISNSPMNIDDEEEEAKEENSSSLVNHESLPETATIVPAPEEDLEEVSEEGSLGGETPVHDEDKPVDEPSVTEETVARTDFRGLFKGEDEAEQPSEVAEYADEPVVEEHEPVEYESVMEEECGAPAEESASAADPVKDDDRTCTPVVDETLEEESQEDTGAATPIMDESPSAEALPKDGELLNELHEEGKPECFITNHESATEDTTQLVVDADAVSQDCVVDKLLEKEEIAEKSPSPRPDDSQETPKAIDEASKEEQELNTAEAGHGEPKPPSDASVNEKSYHSSEKASTNNDHSSKESRHGRDDTKSSHKDSSKRISKDGRDHHRSSHQKSREHHSSHSSRTSSHRDKERKHSSSSSSHNRDRSKTEKRGHSGDSKDRKDHGHHRKRSRHDDRTKTKSHDSSSSSSKRKDTSSSSQHPEQSKNRKLESDEMSPSRKAHKTPAETAQDNEAKEAVPVLERLDELSDDSRGLQIALDENSVDDNPQEVPMDTKDDEEEITDTDPYGREANMDPEFDVPLKKRRRRTSYQRQDTDEAVKGEGRSSGGPAQRGRRRSSAASQQSVGTPETPESPKSSKFGRQRKINPKYEDDGTLSALLFGSKN